MKSELWEKVKVGSWVIYADQDAGVWKAKVVEVDIRIYEPGEPSRWGYPYGKTAETGTVKIRYNETEIYENLENLVTYGPVKLAKLKKDWNRWRAGKAEADVYKETFLARIQEYRVL